MRGALGSLQTLPWKTLATGTGCDSLQRVCLQTGQRAGMPWWLGQREKNQERKATEPGKGQQIQRICSRGSLGMGSTWRPLAECWLREEEYSSWVQRKTGGGGHHLEFCPRQSVVSTGRDRQTRGWG